MTDRLRVVLELGPKGRRVVAGAIDWPGLDRWGNDEHAAIAKLVAYLPRYAGVAERAGMASEFARQTEPTIVERYPGNTSTDFWGIAHVTSETERGVLSEADLERRLDLLQATWAHFDHVAGHVSKELRHGPRGGGRTREEVIRHTLGNEPHQFAPKVEVRNPYEMAFTPDGLAVIRQMYLDGIRAYNAEGKPARSWSIQFLIRRSAQHMMDHAWELEDRDLGGG